MAVGWSSDIVPAAKRLTDVAVIVPKSGASLWADLWVRLFLLISIHSSFVYVCIPLLSNSKEVISKQDKRKGIMR